MKNRIVLLLNPADVRLFIESTFFSEPSLVYALKADVWSELELRNIVHVRIEEEFFEPDWKKILIWSREKALSWSEDPRLASLLQARGVNFGSVLLSYCHDLLENIAADVAIARRILMLHPSDSNELVLWTDALGVFSALAEKSGWKVTHPERMPRCRERKRFSFREVLRRVLSELVSFAAYFNWTPDGSLLCSGGLRHLGSFFEVFRKNKMRFSFLDPVFQFSHWKEISLSGGRYFCEGWLVKRWLARKVSLEKKKLLDSFEKAINKASQKKFFVFDGEDVSMFVSAEFRKLKALMSEYFDGLLFVQELIRKVKPGGLLLDEDTAYRRLYAAAFRAEGKPVYIVSHGVTGADYRIAPEIKNASFGEYLVNSEFEREKYETMGWDSGRIYLTGTPRYDRIFRLKKEARPLTSMPTVLYCPHALTDDGTWALGVNTPGFVTAQDTTRLIESMRGLGCRLWIKPHGDAGDIPLWKEFPKRMDAPFVEVRSPHEDIFSLLWMSDLLVTTFSSVVIEGLLFDLPVITINFTGRPDLHPYAASGVTRAVREPEKLQKEIMACLNNEKVRCELRDARQRHFKYFCGFGDGENTRRAMNFISRDVSELQAPEKIMRSSCL